MSDAERLASFARVQALVQGAELLRDASSTLGRRVRDELVVSTGLSREGVELGLEMSLEANPDGSSRAFADSVAEELAVLSQSVPLGTLDPDEAASVTRFRDAVTYSELVFSAGAGFMGLGGDRLIAAPVGRNLHVLRCDDPVPLLAPMASSIAALGLAVEPELAARLRETLPGARASALGRMQRPHFDGPVDRRPSFAASGRS